MDKSRVGWGLVRDLESFPAGSHGKEYACNAADAVSMPESKSPLEKGMATHSSILAESQGQRSLAGYSL